MSTTDLDREAYMNCAKTSMSSKLVGVDSDFFAEMIVNAANAVKKTGSKGEAKVPIKAINILKAHGGNMKESILVSGYALNCVVACEGLFFCFHISFCLFSQYFKHYSDIHFL